MPIIHSHRTVSLNSVSPICHVVYHLQCLWRHLLGLPLQHDGPLIARAPDSAYVSLGGRPERPWDERQIPKWIRCRCPCDFAIKEQLLFLKLLRQRHLSSLSENLCIGNSGNERRFDSKAILGGWRGHPDRPNEDLLEKIPAKQQNNHN